MKQHPTETFSAEDPLLTCQEVADRYRVNVETVRRWARKGVFRTVRVGPYKLLRIPLLEADKHFRAQRGA